MGHYCLYMDGHIIKPVIARAAQQASCSADASFGYVTLLPESPS